MSSEHARPTAQSGPNKLEALVQHAVDVAKKARKNRQNLQRDNFYGNKLAELRVDATNTFQELTSRSAGDTSALAEMIEEVFSAKTERSRRLEVARELSFALKTTWRGSKPTSNGGRLEALFPLNILKNTKRAYLVSIGRQMNSSYAAGWYDACAVMMRRLVEVAIIEAYEGQNISIKIKNGNGDYVHLSDLVQRSLSETKWTLSRNTKKYLPQLRDVGHMSAHGRYYNAKKGDIDKIQQGCRVVIEEFLHHARLLQK